MPPESSEETPHLTSAPRQHSMFWRQLRPELVVHNNTGYSSAGQHGSTSSSSTYQQHQQQLLREPLSPDAGGLVTSGCSDWEQQIEGVQRATQRLITQVCALLHYTYAQCTASSYAKRLHNTLRASQYVLGDVHARRLSLLCMLVKRAVHANLRRLLQYCRNAL
eukprot:7570-Heterococcus_DN1.PRE.2